MKGVFLYIGQQQMQRYLCPKLFITLVKHRRNVMKSIKLQAYNLNPAA